MLLFVSCLPSEDIYAAKVKLNKLIASVEVGKTTSLKVIGTKKEVKWSSSNKKVASVNKKGTVKGVSAGTTKITAKVGSAKLTCEITVEAVVENEPDISVKLEDMGGSTSLVILKVTNNGELSLTIDPSGYVYNGGYSSVCSDVSLININAKEPEFLDKVVIKSGKTKTICYVNDDFDKFWIDDDTVFDLEFTYDKIKFKGMASISGYFEYKQGRIE